MGWRNVLVAFLGNYFGDSPLVLEPTFVRTTHYHGTYYRVDRDGYVFGSDIFGPKADILRHVRHSSVPEEVRKALGV